MVIERCHTKSMLTWFEAPVLAELWDNEYDAVYDKMGRVPLREPWALTCGRNGVVTRARG